MNHIEKIRCTYFWCKEVHAYQCCFTCPQNADCERACLNNPLKCGLAIAVRRENERAKKKRTVGEDIKE